MDGKDRTKPNTCQFDHPIRVHLDHLVGDAACHVQCSADAMDGALSSSVIASSLLRLRNHPSSVVPCLPLQTAVRAGDLRRSVSCLPEAGRPTSRTCLPVDILSSLAPPNPRSNREVWIDRRDLSYCFLRFLCSVCHKLEGPGFHCCCQMLERSLLDINVRVIAGVPCFFVPVC